MFVRKLFDMRTGWGIFLYAAVNLLSAAILFLLTLVYIVGEFFGTGSKADVIYIGVYFVANLLLNIVITRKSKHRWFFMAIGVFSPICIDVIVWSTQR